MKGIVWVIRKPNGEENGFLPLSFYIYYRDTESTHPIGLF